ncbi:CLUMA_CG011440, isoform A [Clunio marinus]|uniref:CLUMA_CG011440, isoform A n=1 Tax=Clunio marinus TaxID=568069 RepID=A0A1J1ICR3_9DIPT|nr:CLUMA_CG011440, isoform A [Clunio marinus]
MGEQRKENMSIQLNSGTGRLIPKVVSVFLNMTKKNRYKMRSNRELSAEQEQDKDKGKQRH